MVRRDEAIAAELDRARQIFAPSLDCATACMTHSKAGEGLRRRGIAVLPHGLLHPIEERRDRRAGDAVRVGTFGNLNRQKGIEVLVQAMRGVPADLHLHGAVEDDFAEEVRGLASRCDVQLVWHGAYDPAVDHPASRLDLAVFPSLCRETYGLVVEEALAAGTPVIVSAIGALAERLRGGGLSVPPGDVEVLHRALRRLVEDPRALSELGRMVPRDFQTIEAAVEVYRDAYREAIAALRTRT
jgi:glycosyltransferase involved in cell wall biosynthesis